MANLINSGRLRRPYQLALLLGRAMITVFVCPIMTAPVRAQCTSSGTTTSCSPGGNAYGRGISVARTENAGLVSHEGGVVERQAIPAEVPMAGTGNAALLSSDAWHVSTSADNVVAAGGSVDVAVGKMIATGSGAAAPGVRSVSTGGVQRAGIMVNADSSVTLALNTIWPGGGRKCEHQRAGRGRA